MIIKDSKLKSALNINKFPNLKLNLVGFLFSQWSGIYRAWLIQSIAIMDTRENWLLKYIIFSEGLYCIVYG